MKRYIATLAASCLTAMSIYTCFWYYTLGGNPSEPWVEDIYIAKLYAAKKISGRKIIIASGSNGLFGISCQIIQSITGLPTINLASHGGLPVHFIADKAIEISNPGDIIIMPLEFYYYGIDEKPWLWQIQNIKVWGELDKKPWWEAFKYFKYSRLGDIINTLFFKHPWNTDYKKIISHMDQAGLASKWCGYDYKSLNAFGDILVDAPPTEEIIAAVEQGIPYCDFPDEEYPAPYIMQEIANIKKKAETVGALLYITWPVSIQNKAFDLNDAKLKRKLRQLADKIGGMGINFICEPERFNMEIYFFYDGMYHLNKNGAIERSKVLGECMRSIAVQ
jgi:hypothetical protein